MKVCYLLRYGNKFKNADHVLSKNPKLLQNRRIKPIEEDPAWFYRMVYNTQSHYIVSLVETINASAHKRTT